jgi:hypothetical protein
MNESTSHTLRAAAKVARKAHWAVTVVVPEAHGVSDCARAVAEAEGVDAAIQVTHGTVSVRFANVPGGLTARVVRPGVKQDLGFAQFPHNA